MRETPHLCFPWSLGRAHAISYGQICASELKRKSQNKLAKLLYSYTQIVEGTGISTPPSPAAVYNFPSATTTYIIGLADTRAAEMPETLRRSLEEKIRKKRAAAEQLATGRGNQQACKTKFRLRELILCFCYVQTSHAALKADSQGTNRTLTGSELSQPKSEFTGAETREVKGGHWHRSYRGCHWFWRRHFICLTDR